MGQALSDYPDLLTVEEAASYLRISRALGISLRGNTGSPMALLAYPSFSWGDVSGYQKTNSPC